MFSVAFRVVIGATLTTPFCCRFRPGHVLNRPSITARILLVTIEWPSQVLSGHDLTMSRLLPRIKVDIGELLRQPQGIIRAERS